MMPVGIPDWNAQRVLPPNDSSDPGSASRSPYMVRLDEVVLRFGTSGERRALLEGLLQYRAALHAVGLVRGFQWLDGSFLEDIEVLESRPPNDLDVVTFFRNPDGGLDDSVAPQTMQLLDRRVAKQRLRLDVYYEDLGLASEGIVDRAVYWYSLWSHRRDNSWKGYLQVDLAPDQDAAARALLATAEEQP